MGWRRWCRLDPPAFAVRGNAPSLRRRGKGTASSHSAGRARSTWSRPPTTIAHAPPQPRGKLTRPAMLKAPSPPHRVPTPGHPDRGRGEGSTHRDHSSEIRTIFEIESDGLGRHTRPGRRARHPFRFGPGPVWCPDGGCQRWPRVRLSWHSRSWASATSATLPATDWTCRIGRCTTLRRWT